MPVGWEGLEPRRAAVVQGCTPAVFGVRLSRARRRLRAALEEIEAEDGRAPGMTLEEEAT